MSGKSVLMLDAGNWMLVLDSNYWMLVTDIQYPVSNLHYRTLFIPAAGATKRTPPENNWRA
jgi:hypothetical protein